MAAAPRTVTDNIQVLVRVRPPNAREHEQVGKGSAPPLNHRGTKQKITAKKHA